MQRRRPPRRSARSAMPKRQRTTPSPPSSADAGRVSAQAFVDKRLDSRAAGCCSRQCGSTTRPKPEPVCWRQRSERRCARAITRLPNGARPQSITRSPDGSLLAITDNGGGAFVLSTVDLSPVRVDRGHRRRVDVPPRRKTGVLHQRDDRRRRRPGGRRRPPAAGRRPRQVRRRAWPGGRPNQCGRARPVPERRRAIRRVRARHGVGRTSTGRTDRTGRIRGHRLQRAVAPGWHAVVRGRVRDDHGPRPPRPWPCNTRRRWPAGPSP